jgi:rare lipoprotein A (peptidoglycan hydrolase)
MNIKLSYIFILVFLLLNSNQIFAQKIYPTSLTTINYLDSANVKKYQKKNDTHRIKIELNHITGIASFYSPSLDGTLTATGEIFKNSKYTAACNLYKLNTLVRVTNMRNGRTVLVRINDRMHPNMLKLGRVVDLSRTAAQKINLSSKGIVKVTLDAVGFSKINPKKQ